MVWGVMANFFAKRILKITVFEDRPLKWCSFRIHFFSVNKCDIPVEYSGWNKNLFVSAILGKWFYLFKWDHSNMTFRKTIWQWWKLLERLDSWWSTPSNPGIGQYDELWSVDHSKTSAFHGQSSKLGVWVCIHFEWLCGVDFGPSFLKN